MNDIERLAVEQAIYNSIGADLKTGVPDNLRGRVNDGYLAAYEQTGATGFEVRLNNVKVGTYGFPKVKGTPDTIRRSGTLRVRPEKVAEAMAFELPSAIVGLLGGGQ